jgi:hypothetical protein
MSQNLIKLSDENKQALLKKASQSVLGRRDEAGAILEQLHRLNDTLAEQFQPKHVALEDLTLRMLCFPKAESVGWVSSFLIISYCWHKKDWRLAPAAHRICQGWEISQPMVDKILSLRASENEGVWLDKLCIKQDNKDEKKIAIGSMDIIYRSARQLIILLEDVQLDEEEDDAGSRYTKMFEGLCREVQERDLTGVEKSKFIDDYFNFKSKEIEDELRKKEFKDLPRKKELEDDGKEKKGNEEEKGGERVENEDGGKEKGGEEKDGHESASKRFVMKMLGARWFSRAWCAHESRVVPHLKVNNPLFLCFGSDGRVLSFEFRFIHFLALRLRQSEREPSAIRDSSFLNFMNDPNPASLYQRTWQLQRLLPDTNPDTSPMQYLVSITTFNCENEEDLVSIALNTSGIPLFFQGSLGAKEDIFWILSLLVIASGDLVPLIEGGKKLHLGDSQRKKVVSWVDLPYSAPLEDRLPILSTDSINRAEKDFIELDLFVFNQMPQKASQASLEKASSIIEKYDLQTQSEELGTGVDEFTKKVMEDIVKGMSHSRVARGLTNTFLQTLLGSAIDCGIDWIRRFPSVMRKGTERSWVHGTFDCYNTKFTDAAIELLSYFGIAKDNTPDFDQNYLQQSVRFLTCITDCRLKFLTVTPRRIQARAGDFAITQLISNRSWVAVPVAIAHLPISYKKAWIIEPFDPSADPEKPEDHLPKRLPNEGDEAEDIFPVLTCDYKNKRAERNEKKTWRLRKKQLIFGCQPIEADESSVMLLKSQKVYGAEDYDWTAIGNAQAAAAAASSQRAQDVPQSS